MDPLGSGGAPPPPPPPPPLLVHRPSGGNSFGPLIVALAVIAVLGALAVVMGRVCFGRRSLRLFGFGFGHGGHGGRSYDLEAWVETKCASCVDGRMDQVLPPRPRPPSAAPITTTPPPAPLAAGAEAPLPKEPPRRDS